MACEYILFFILVCKSLGIFFSGDDVQTDMALFEMFKNQDTGLLPIGKFLSVSRKEKYNLCYYWLHFRHSNQLD